MDIIFIILGLVLFVYMVSLVKKTGRNPWGWGILFFLTGLIGYGIFAIDCAIRGNLNERS